MKLNIYNDDRYVDIVELETLHVNVSPYLAIYSERETYTSDSCKC